MGITSSWRLLCPALVAALLLSAAPAGATPVEWTGNGHFYDVVTANTTWPGAESAAESTSYEGAVGHLVTIGSAAENLWLTNTFGAGNLGARWLGGTQAPNSKEPDGGWSWVTGEPWKYTNWANGEPNNAGGSEDTLEFYNMDADGACWNDRMGGPSSTAWGYVVEYDVTPEPATIALLGSGLVGLILSRRRKVC